MTIRYEKDSDNIVTLTFDRPGRPVNVLDEVFFADLSKCIERLADDKPLRGVILASAKKTFFAGADLEYLYEMRDPKVVFANNQRFKAGIRKLETLGVPVVAAMNGTALGGGLEVALAAHHRVAINDPKARIGCPETTLGLMPGAGGTVRITRMLGLEAAAPYVVEGKQVSPADAKTAGLVEELADDAEDMFAKARAWIAANPEAAQPWDKKGYRLPGGEPASPRIAQMLAIAPAMQRKRTFGNYPATEAAMAAMVKGAMVDFDTAGRIESRYFARIATGQTAKNMLSALWFQMNKVNGGASRPKDVPPQETRKLGVLGAGFMGHGIAYVSAVAGIDVVMKDMTLEKAQAGKANIAKLLDGEVSRGRMTEAQKAEVLARVLATGSADDLKGCDLIIEAVFENAGVKAQATQEAEARLDSNAIFGSNTSSLPITGLAQASARPENFIGIHFFSPVHRMRLVEIILGKKTSKQALAKAFDYVLKIRKTPIVVNDSRGFYTSRVFGTYINEGAALLSEGQNPRAIESAGQQAGMPVGPLAVADEVNLGLALHIQQETQKAYAAEGKTYERAPADDVLDLMVNQLKRPGRAQGAGFYEYPGEGAKFLWPGLRDQFPPAREKLSQEEMIHRLMFVQALETARCLDEGVLNSVADANVGSILGWGFPPFKGGTLQYINDFGVAAFVERSRELAARYGPRFQPPARLITMAEKGETFQ